VKTEVNWSLIQRLAIKTHKHLNIDDNAQYGAVRDGVFDSGNNGVGEVMQEARTVHHLLDLAGVPEGEGYSAHVDARAYLLVVEVIELRDRLARIADWHSRETGPAGTVGDFCNECGQKWPCETHRMATGVHEDGDAG
jgi:hypothetical protein